MCTDIRSEAGGRNRLRRDVALSFEQRRSHGDQFLGDSRVNSDGIVEIALRRSHVDRDREPLQNLVGTRSDEVTPTTFSSGPATTSFIAVFTLRLVKA